MKVFVVVTTVKGRVYHVEVFCERRLAASLVMKEVEALNAKSKNPEPVVWTDENASGVYRAKAGDIVSQLFEREV